MSEAAQTLLFGVLGKPHGLQGDIVLRVFNAAVDRLRRLPVPVEVVVTGPNIREARILRSARESGGDFLLRFAGVESREQAALLTNRELRVPRASLPALAPGQFYVEDLIGCTVVDLEGNDRGIIETTLWNGAQDIISVKDKAGGELLLPVVPEFIRNVDVGAGRVLVDPHE